jgi:hypothetical protein
MRCHGQEHSRRRCRAHTARSDTREGEPCSKILRTTLRTESSSMCIHMRTHARPHTHTHTNTNTHTHKHKHTPGSATWRSSPAGPWPAKSSTFSACRSLVTLWLVSFEAARTRRRGGLSLPHVMAQQYVSSSSYCMYPPPHMTEQQYVVMHVSSSSYGMHVMYPPPHTAQQYVVMCPVRCHVTSQQQEDWTEQDSVSGAAWKLRTPRTHEFVQLLIVTPGVKQI